MTNDRLVNLGRMAMHPKRLDLISDNSVLNAFISKGPRKLNKRRFEEGCRRATRHSARGAKIKYLTSSAKKNVFLPPKHF